MSDSEYSVIKSDIMKSFDCILRCHRLQFSKINIEFLSLKVDFVLANSADPDEMLHYVAFHLGLHCLPKYMFRSFRSTKG